MIDSREKLKYYLECDRIALRRGRMRPPLFGDVIWKYEWYLRKYEYYLNTNLLFGALGKFFYRCLYTFYSHKCECGIVPNVAGPGLSIAHVGRIIVNSNSKIGNNCRIQTGVTLGATNGSGKSPVLGNNVFLGEGCKLIGDIYIADGVQIGANAVVVKSIMEKNTTWGGIPAKKISNHSSELNLVDATKIYAEMTRTKRQ